MRRQEQAAVAAAKYAGGAPAAEGSVRRAAAAASRSSTLSSFSECWFHSPSEAAAVHRVFLRSCGGGACCAKRSRRAQPREESRRRRCTSSRRRCRRAHHVSALRSERSNSCPASSVRLGIELVLEEPSSPARRRHPAARPHQVLAAGGAAAPSSGSIERAVDERREAAAAAASGGTWRPPARLQPRERPPQQRRRAHRRPAAAAVRRARIHASAASGTSCTFCPTDLEGCVSEPTRAGARQPVNEAVRGGSSSMRCRLRVHRLAVEVGVIAARALLEHDRRDLRAASRSRTATPCRGRSGSTAPGARRVTQLLRERQAWKTVSQRARGWYGTPRAHRLCVRGARSRAVAGSPRGARQPGDGRSPSVCLQLEPFVATAKNALTHTDTPAHETDFSMYLSSVVGTRKNALLPVDEEAIGLISCG